MCRADCVLTRCSASLHRIAELGSVSGSVRRARCQRRSDCISNTSPSWRCQQLGQRSERSNAIATQFTQAASEASPTFSWSADDGGRMASAAMDGPDCSAALSSRSRASASDVVRGRSRSPVLRLSISHRRASATKTSIPSRRSSIAASRRYASSARAVMGRVLRG
jgi:hypothetical protein